MTMRAISTFLPVFVMLGLGVFARGRAILSSREADGVKRLTFDLLFPVMVFSALFTSEVSSDLLPIAGAVFVFRLLVMAIADMVGKVAGHGHGRLWRYLFPTTDGGNVVFPLYASIVGAGFIGNIVLLDLSSMAMMFLVIPAMIAAEGDGEANGVKGKAAGLRRLLCNVGSNPTVVSMALGLALNLSGAYTWLQASEFADLYEGVVDMVTGPIVALVLFGIGYDLHVDRDSLASLGIALGIRTLLMALVTLAMLALFPAQAADREMFVALVLYFVCSPGLMLASLLQPACKGPDEEAYVSAFLSLSMLVSIAWYVAVVLLFG